MEEKKTDDKYKQKLKELEFQFRTKAVEIEELKSKLNFALTELYRLEGSIRTLQSLTKKDEKTETFK